MKTLVVTIAALATSATLFTAAPASAQSVGVVVDNPGVSVRIGDRGRHYGWERGKHRGWYRDNASCREVTVRTRRPDGSIVIRKRSSC